MFNYRVHYMRPYSVGERITGVYCLEVAQDIAIAKNGQITDMQGVIVPSNLPGYCLQCDITHI